MSSSDDASQDNGFPAGSHAHQRAKFAALQRYMAVRHIIAYYYKVHGIDVPAACDDYPVDRLSQPSAPKEFAARVAICHHLACSGFEPDELDSIGRLVIHERVRECPMAEIIMQCGTLLKHEEFLAGFSSDDLMVDHRILKTWIGSNA